MKLVNELFARIDALSLKDKSIKAKDVFMAAGVHPELIRFWKKRQPKSWEKWVALLNDNAKPMPVPGESTYAAFGSSAQDLFLAAGYARSEIFTLWQHKDAKSVEHYKKVVTKIQQLEHELYRRANADAQSKKGKETVMA